MLPDFERPDLPTGTDQLALGPKPRNGYMKYGWSRPPSTRLVGPASEPRGGTPLRGSLPGGLVAAFRGLRPRAIIRHRPAAPECQQILESIQSSEGASPSRDPDGGDELPYERAPVS